MPHIEVVFSGDQAIWKFLYFNKIGLVEVISSFLGYPAEVVGFLPRRIDDRDIPLIHNMQPLEFIVNSGEKTVGVDDERAEEIVKAIVARCPEAVQIPFAVWVIAHSNNGFAVHIPD